MTNQSGTLKSRCIRRIWAHDERSFKIDSVGFADLVNHLFPESRMQLYSRCISCEGLARGRGAKRAEESICRIRVSCREKVWEAQDLMKNYCYGRVHLVPYLIPENKRLTVIELLPGRSSVGL